MAQEVREVMTSKVIALQSNQTIVNAAREMRDHNLGDVMILDGDQVCGILTDRDIVIRAVAESTNFNVRLGEVCTHELATLNTTDSVDQAVQLMREMSVRRLPVIENGQPVGIVSLGDLAMNRDPSSVLAILSAAEPNR